MLKILSWSTASSTFCRWLMGGSITSSVHTFANKQSRFLIDNIKIFPAGMTIWDTYQHPVVNIRNQLTTWTEKSIGIFLIFCVFFRSRFAIINLLRRIDLRQSLTVIYFFIIIENMSIVTSESRFIYSRMVGLLFMVHVCFRLGKNIAFGTKNKPVTCPGHRLINAVQFSLQSDRNTQHRFSIILVIYTAFETPLARSFPTTKISILTIIILFEGLRFQNTLVNIIMLCSFYLFQNKLTRTIYFMYE